MAFNYRGLERLETPYEFKEESRLLFSRTYLLGFPFRSVRGVESRSLAVTFSTQKA